ncbi:UDP-glucose 4-epimerase GalE [Candidatus Woesearchaeota archaeon]|nr:UDP-glucose 4-epimerase GalE [Candidatus Woesearchaeota archaeon]
MNILVTGGAGYIGSHTVHELVNQGFDVIVLDSLENGHKEFLPENIHLFKGNLASLSDIEKVFISHKIDAVIHFAAYALVGESMENPVKYFHNNLAGGINLIKTMLKFNVKNIVFSSTCATYGIPERLPLDEIHPTNPVNYYGLSKRMFEQVLESSQIQGMNYVILRYFNAAGAAFGIGEKHNPETHLIPLVLEVALGKKDHVKVFGTDYPTKDGTCIRDYIHVLDLASAHILALKSLWVEKSGVYNLGTGKGTSVKEVIDICKEVSGKDIKVVEEARRPGDPPELVASPIKAKKELGWEAKHNIKDIIKSAWEWHSKHKDI